MSSDQAQELAAVIARAQHNDGAAYEAIYQHYAGRLQRYLYSRCCDWDLAEELLSDVWLRVVQHLPRFTIPSDGADRAFTRWLFTICHNQLCDAVRRRSQLLVVTLSELTEASAPDLEAASDLDQALVAQDERRALVRAMNMLTPEQRDVILLRFHEEHTSADVATLTGRTQEAVKALQHRALRSLARAMAIELV